ncbi:MAG: hypothetical protein IPJ33_06710 [Gammaproteobacteria bacterium]|nr:hypothetical protein [Gammaproteobacteria bacterium]
MSEQGEPGLLREGETAGKAAVDKMAHDMGVELRAHGVAVVSIWMGLLKTERTEAVLADPELARHYEHLLETMETPQLTGLVIDALARDPHLMDRSAKVWIGAELARQYGIRDVNGREPPRTVRCWAIPGIQRRDHPVGGRDVIERLR